MCWEQNGFAFVHKGDEGRLYGVIFPGWGGEPPLVIDLAGLLPSVTYNLESIQESYRSRIQNGVRNMIPDKERDMTQTNTSPFDEYCRPAAYLHHAALLQLNELLGCVRFIKMGIAVYYAAKQGHEDLLKLLLESAAYPDYTDENGWTALNFAIDKTNIEMTRLLLVHGSNPNVVDKSG